MRSIGKHPPHLRNEDRHPGRAGDLTGAKSKENKVESHSSSFAVYGLEESACLLPALTVYHFMTSPIPG